MSPPRRQTPKKSTAKKAPAKRAAAKKVTALPPPVDVVDDAPSGPRFGTLEAEVEEAIGGMSWLQASDKAAVELARQYARAIDKAEAEGPEALTKALYLGPHLLQALRALGGTPGDRKNLGVAEGAHGKLAQLRANRTKAS